MQFWRAQHRSETRTISPFSISGAHAHWVGSLDTPSHVTKGKKSAKGTGSLIALLSVKLGKTKNIEVLVTPWFAPLPQLRVLNDLVPLAHFFPLVQCLPTLFQPRHTFLEPLTRRHTAFMAIIL